MAEQLQRLPRPSTALETQDVTQLSSARGLNRSNLTLYFSIAAILLSVASSGVQLVIFFAGHQQQMAAQAALDAKQKELAEVQIQTERGRARAADYEAALRVQEIKTSAAQEQEAIAAKVHHNQDTALARPETRIAEYKAAFDGVTIGDPEVRRILSEVLKGGLKGGDIPGLSPRIERPFPMGLGTMPGQTPTDSYDKYAILK